LGFIPFGKRRFVEVLGGAETLDRYRLERPLAVVGSDTVWLAEDARLHRRVTIRHVVPQAAEGEASSAAIARFAREARAAARFVSGPIVTIYDVVETSEAVYVVSEFIDAPTLSESVRENGPLSAAAAASMALHLLQAINYVHAHNAIHGRINPSTVFLFQDGSVKLAELGMSNDSRAREQSALDRYRAPELSHGETASTATDFWCLGATLHYALHGTAPSAHRVTAVGGFESTGAARLHKIVSDLLDDDPARRPNATQLRRRLLAVGPAPRRHGGDVAPNEALTMEPQLVAETIPTEEVPQRSYRPMTIGALVPAIALLLLLLLVFLGMRSADHPETATPPSTSSGAASDASIVSGTASGTVAATVTSGATTAAPTPTITTTSSVPTPSPSRSNALPADWITYRDEASGYKIAKPKNWTIRPLTPYRTDFIDPASGAFIRVEWTDQPGPDPVEAWRAQARLFAERQAGYEELRIDAAAFKGYKAAEWEFRYLERGALRHALDIGLITGRYGAALFAVAPEPMWQGFQATLDNFRTSFEPPT
jgi:eukaryotic-like serine/threonine-protein kinase